MSDHRPPATERTVDHTPSAEPWLKIAFASVAVAAVALFLPSPVKNIGLGAAVLLCAVAVVLLVRQEMRG